MELHKLIVQENHGRTPEHMPQLVDLTLQEIVNAGKITNSYQLFVLGRVATFFKDGLKNFTGHFENPVNFDTGETSTVLKKYLESLSPEDHVQLAQYLLDCIKAGESLLHDKSAEITNWIRFVLRKQD